MPEHRVTQGDCLLSLAKEHGFSWETLWNHPDNAELKRLRKDPNALKPGDVLVIPERRDKQEDAAGEAKTQFRRTGALARLRLEILAVPTPASGASGTQEGGGETQQSEGGGGSATQQGGGEGGGATQQSEGGDGGGAQAPAEPEPLADTAFTLDAGGSIQEGNTDGEGRIDVPVPAGARQAELVLSPGTPDERRLTLLLGGLDPAAEVTGVKQRLANLGFPAGDESDGAETPELEQALSAFQQHCELEVTGRIDDTTRDRLVEEHGS
ncbi:MAG: peptidoglycan-binding protein [Candidatus Krumholzibacteriota bacterium]|nr:peptidoglycan-binding protein [Candidatus Krumholzibacteriota bacterium]